MSAEVRTHARSRTQRRLAVTGRPTRHDLTDAAFVAALGGLALYGFRTTFDNTQFMLVGVIGLVLGIGVAHVATSLRQHWLVLMVLVACAFFLLGGALTLNSETFAGFLPTGGAVHHLGILAVTSWKELLTTLPPVDGTGQFLVVPYLLGLVTGAATFSWARQTTAPSWPVTVPLASLVVVILLGTLEPGGLLVQGLGFTTAAFAWTVARRRRLIRIVGTGTRGRSQAVMGATLIAVSLGAAAAVGGQLPGIDTHQRTVLRTYVEPPFDIARYPSPLVGFRKYTQGAKLVWDQKLFTVTGAPAGTLIRMAVLDSYVGTVWGAGDPSTPQVSAFRKVGPTIGAPSILDPQGHPITVTIDPAYAGLADANSWVPGIGPARSITFQGPDAAALQDSLRYNTETGQAVVASRLTAGDVITLTAQPIATVPASFQPGGSSTLDPSTYGFVGAAATKWAQKKPTPWTQIQAVANTLRTQGAYSDGTRSGETQYLPGHGAGRLATFVNAQQPIGNDEQYAATFALMANNLGVPARVVLGAETPTNGIVRGQNVHAWVEVRGTTGDWYAIPYTAFMPNRDKHPDQKPPPPAPDANAAIVPPPNSTRPPGALDSTFNTDPNATRVKTPHAAQRHEIQLPAWVSTTLKVAGVPVLLLLSFALVVGLLRLLRRYRRRTRGPESLRLSQGWRDYVDHARDLGRTVPPGLTRTEQAAIVGRRDLAATADRAVFAWQDPDSAEIANYWRDIAGARRTLSKEHPRSRRLRRLISVRGLVSRDLRPVELQPRQATAGATRRRPGLRQARA